MKQILTLCLAVLLCTGAKAQLLWKVSGNGLSQPSYVIGTYHLADASFADSISGLKAALDATEQVYGEVDMSVMANQDSALKMQQAMLLPEGMTIDKLLTAGELSRLNAFVKTNLGVDPAENQMVAGQLYKLKPAMLSTQLSVLMFLKHHSNFNPNNLFDGYFQKTAAAQGKPVGGLETLNFQINILTERKSLKRQAQELMCLVDHSDYMADVADRTVKAFYSQDLKALASTIDEKMNNACDATPAEKAALLDDRNADWAAKLPAIMKSRPTFIAVGAGHLPGEKGLLALLRQAGYDVSPVR